MIKRVTLCSIAFILTYCIIYAVSYNGKREEIEQKINGLFAANAHSFADSILVREGIPIKEYHDSERFKEVHDYILEDEKGVITIPHAYIKVYDFAEFRNREEQTFMLHLGQFDLNIADSVWNNILKAAGFDVESALFLSTRDLRDMFPEGGEINLDIKAPIVSAKHMNGRDCFVTDSIGLGIQNQAYLFSEVHIPALQVMKSAKWWGLKRWVAICTSITVWLFTSKGNKEEKNAIEEIESNESTTATTIDIPLTTIEDITYNYNEKSVTNTRTGEQVKLPGTQATTFEMLINADDYIATKKEICQRLWTINEKDVNNRYNALAWRLRESLAQINGIELLTIKDTALQLVFTKKKGKE